MEKLFWKRREPKKETTNMNYTQKKDNLKILEQRGTSNRKRDIPRRALLPGKRVSSYGKIYWETRKNRSDASGSKT